MTLCPRDVTECNAPVTWQRVLQATAVHRNSMRFLSLSLSFFLVRSSPSFSSLRSLPLSLFPSLSCPDSLPFPKCAFELTNRETPPTGALAKNGHVIGPAKCQTSTNGRREGRRSPGLLQMTLIALRRIIAARADREGWKMKMLAIFAVSRHLVASGRVLRKGHGKFQLDGLEEFLRSVSMIEAGRFDDFP